MMKGNRLPVPFKFKTINMRAYRTQIDGLSFIPHLKIKLPV